ncbi:serine hydrolase domain-containing protein [Virgibacillus sp. C22-A2]|uniref:Serine hydrolase domain-containing protein n=1 Tax=Virgibacillus tibetensis TaxID=3042313 RepID=A0ABU6KIN8_9BACI|nr:serine hydrolase domain-containing protein [Virgibacillus sp. C22-A2]
MLALLIIEYLKVRRNYDYREKFKRQFKPVVSHVKDTSQVLDGSGASVMVIHNNKIVIEEYWEKHSKAPDAIPIQEETQFHVASVRKSYIGFAVAYAIHHGYIESIDDEVNKYLPVKYTELFKNTTIRHLLTHTHGLNTEEGKIIREFASGHSWAYRDMGIELLTQIVKLTTGKTIAQILREQVFKPLEFNESGWHDEANEKLV